MSQVNGGRMKKCWRKNNGNYDNPVTAIMVVMVLGLQKRKKKDFQPKQ